VAGRLIVQVVDRNSGAPVDRVGLQIIQDRVDALEGSLSVRSGASGTTVTVRIPTGAREQVGARG